MKKKKAFLTGLTGQDGSYLAELLLSLNYEVHGILRRASVFNTERIDHIFDHPSLITYHGDLTDSSNLHQLLQRIQPDEVYNLGAQSHVAVSFEVPEYTAEVTGVGTLRLLNAIRDLEIDCKFYQASTSELFGGLPGSAPQDEDTPFHPKSPYGVAKLYSYWITKNFRESYNLHASNGILFNHESPRRGKTFVTKKISEAVAKIKCGKQDVLTLGNLDAMRDWGHARDFVKAMWLILQQDIPDDYVIATGQTHTVRYFVEEAFRVVDINIRWEGSGVNERGVCVETGKTFVKISQKYFRPSEVEILHGNPSKAKSLLGWEPEISLKQLIEEMVLSDLELV